MAISFSHDKKVYYTVSFAAMLALLPWSLRLSSYALLAMCVAGVLTTSWQLKKQRAVNNPIALIFYGLFLIYIAGLFYTNNLQEGLKSIEQKLAFLIFPLVVTTSVPLDGSDQKRILNTFLASCLLFTITFFSYNLYLITRGADYMQLNFDPITQHNFSSIHAAASDWSRMSYISFTNGLMGPTYLSLYLTLCTLLIYYREPKTILGVILRYIGIVWLTIIIILLASRMGIFTFLIVITLNLVYDLYQKNYSVVKITASTLTLFVITFSLIMISPVTRFRLVEEPLRTPLSIPTTPDSWNSINLRFLEWRSGIESIRENGLAGTGTGGALDALQEKYQRVQLGSFAATYNSHNQYIETYLEIGLFGFIALLACLTLPLIRAVRNKHILLFSLVIITSLGCLSTCMFEKQKGLMFYMGFVSIFLFSSPPKTSKA